MRAGFARKSDFKSVSVDTTVQEKAVAYPTDANLIYKGITLVPKGARKFDLKLRLQAQKRDSKNKLYSCMLRRWNV